jgi:2-hydroxy-6-oxonona-2,4-dienedioate hydrolase
MSAIPLTEAATSRSIQTKKWRLHYNEAGSGRPLIMLHGTGPGATGWGNFHQNFGPLAKRYRVILLDFPGWGGSDPLTPDMGPRNSALAEAVKLLMDELNLERAALVGNSMGGGAAIQFAIDYPERLSELVTMGAGLLGVPNLFAPSGLSEGLKVIRETYENPSPENFRRLVNVMVYDPSFVTGALLEQRSKAALANPDHLANWLAYARTGPPTVSGDILASLSRCKSRSLFIHGRDDRVVHIENSFRAATITPDSRLMVFNRCGHWAQVEHAAEFNAVVDTFLSPWDVDPREGANAAFGS